MTRTEIKAFYTTQILSKIDSNLAYGDIWNNLSKSGGLRLSTNGFILFKDKLEIEHNDFVISQGDMSLKTIFLLDKHLKTPYYIKPGKAISNLLLFGNQEAMLLKIYGDLTAFLESYTK